MLRFQAQEIIANQQDQIQKDNCSLNQNNKYKISTGQSDRKKYEKDANKFYKKQSDSSRKKLQSLTLQNPQQQIIKGTNFNANHHIQNKISMLARQNTSKSSLNNLLNQNQYLMKKIYRQCASKQTIMGTKNNERLEGWTQQNNMHQQTISQLNHHQKNGIASAYKILNTKQRPESRKRENQFGSTKNFLKQIQLKYARNFRNSCSKSNCFQKQKQNKDIILIQDKHSKQLQKLDFNAKMQTQSFLQKYSQKKQLSMKTIYPNAQYCFRNLNSSNKNLQQRVNHDGFIPRPQSKSNKSRVCSKLNFNAVNSFDLRVRSQDSLMQNYDIRHVTIDSSQFTQIKKKQTHYIGYTKLKQSKKAKSISTMQIDINIKHEQGGVSKLALRKQKNRTKFKLKYIRSLKLYEPPNQNCINPEISEHTKTCTKNEIRTLRSIDVDENTQNQNYHILQNNMENAQLACQQTIYSKGNEQFEKLKSLLKKQEQSVYLLYQNNNNKNQNNYLSPAKLQRQTEINNIMCRQKLYSKKYAGLKKQ